MYLIAGFLGVALILIVLLDAFETVILPRRVNRKFRLTRFFYVGFWLPWRWLAFRLYSKRKKQDAFLAFFGPISLLFLFVLWAVFLIGAFGLLQWSIGSPLVAADGRPSTLSTDLYMSGTNFFTLGLGDITPRTPLARFLTIMEAGIGFGMLAAVIGYLPTIYQAFSRREVTIALLDARAGSPPTAFELMRRHSDDLNSLVELFAEWERLASDLMESHISYPVLCYYRSQHDNQSWIAALTAVLDACALVMAGIEGIPRRQAQLTFAIARHAMVDLAQIMGRAPIPNACPRLSDRERIGLRTMLGGHGIKVEGSDEKLDELRLLYEPYVVSLAGYLAMDVPAWIKAPDAKDNWTTSAWTVSH